MIPSILFFTLNTRPFIPLETSLTKMPECRNAGTSRGKVGRPECRNAIIHLTERSLNSEEGETAYPATNLKKPIKLYLQNAVFAERHKRDEAKAFWKQHRL